MTFGTTKMTTEKLIAILKKYPGYTVILSSDGEGNSFGLAHGFSATARFVGGPEDTIILWPGEQVELDE